MRLAISHGTIIQFENGFPVATPIPPQNLPALVAETATQGGDEDERDHGDTESILVPVAPTDLQLSETSSCDATGQSQKATVVDASEAEQSTSAAPGEQQASFEGRANADSPPEEASGFHAAPVFQDARPRPT